MKRCLLLAAKGFGKVAPNPMVGSVIVHQGKIIGEGYHQKYGSAHAEVNAINSVKDKSLLCQSTLYVNLEPCSHYGKTPPCADLIIRHKIKYVVIGKMDPNPKVAGKGVHKLLLAGCDVKVGVLEKDCSELNKRFYTFHLEKRPFIILKWAQTANGYIGINNQRLKISGKDTDQLVHNWRSKEQAIMVGTNTVVIDNPKLTARNVKGKNPLRIILDRSLRIADTQHVLDRSTPTVVFTSKSKKNKTNLEYEKIDFKKDVLQQISRKLYEMNIQSVLVEGGTTLLSSLINKEFWDEAAVICSKGKKLSRSQTGKAIKAPALNGSLVRKLKKKNDIITFYKR